MEQMIDRITDVVRTTLAADDPNRHISVREVALLIGVSTETVRRNPTLFGASVKVGRLRRYRLGDVREYLATLKR